MYYVNSRRNRFDFQTPVIVDGSLFEVNMLVYDDAYRIVNSEVTLIWLDYI